MKKSIMSLIIFLFIVFFIGQPMFLHAKRGLPPGTISVLYNKSVISSFDDITDSKAEYGIIIRNGQNKDKIILYSIIENKSLEGDVQFDYIKSLTIVENIVIVSTEKGCVFSYNMDDKTISILNRPIFYKILDLQKVKSINEEVIKLHYIP